MSKKKNRIPFEKYPLSKCNLKATENMTVYPLQAVAKTCPICGKTLLENYVLAVQVGQSVCVKIHGGACYSCEALFSRETVLTNWLISHGYNQGVLKIDNSYNKSFGLSRWKHVFYEVKSVFRLYSLLCEDNVRVVLVTIKLADENSEQGIVYYLDSLAQVLLKAEKNFENRVCLDGKVYTIVQTIKKAVDKKMIDEELQRYSEMRKAYLPPFTSETSLYIYRSRIANHEFHTTKEVRASVSYLKRNWLFYAEYCFDCGMYLMKYEDYETYLKRFDFFPCRVERDDWGYEKSSFNDRSDESTLHLIGYNVNQQNGLSKEKRRELLEYVVNAKIMRKRKIIDHLEMLIKTNGKSARNWMACKKWEEDKEWLLDYSEKPVPVVVIGKVERFRRKNN